MDYKHTKIATASFQGAEQIRVLGSTCCGHSKTRENNLGSTISTLIHAVSQIFKAPTSALWMLSAAKPVSELMIG